MKNNKAGFYPLFILLITLKACTCNNSAPLHEMKDSVRVVVDSVLNPIDKDTLQQGEDTVAIRDTVRKHHYKKIKKGSRSPASITEEKVAKGYAIVYCPTRMIRNTPSILNATISKDEMDSAVAKFADKILAKNPEKSKQKISRDIKGDTIDIYEKMGVTIEFDEDDFKQVSKNNGEIKEFRNKKALEWEWILKPLRSTQKSIIVFKFFYVDPADKQNYILEKTISISATVDARSFINKWADFLLEDPKTTITAIIIPFLTFLGGLFWGKRNAGKG